MQNVRKSMQRRHWVARITSPNGAPKLKTRPGDFPGQISYQTTSNCNKYIEYSLANASSSVGLKDKSWSSSAPRPDSLERERLRLPGDRDFKSLPLSTGSSRPPPSIPLIFRGLSAGRSTSSSLGCACERKMRARFLALFCVCLLTSAGASWLRRTGEPQTLISGMDWSEWDPNPVHHLPEHRMLSFKSENGSLRIVTGTAGAHNVCNLTVVSPCVLSPRVCMTKNVI